MKTGIYHLFFNNLANPLRIEIISVLKKKDMSVGELAEKINAEQSKLSHALANLRRCNMVNFERKGKIKIYSLNKKTLLPLLNIIGNHTSESCGENCRHCEICKMEMIK